MELDNQAFKDFKVTQNVRRVKQTSRKGPTPQRDVSKFIQSALASNTPVVSPSTACPPTNLGRSGKKRTTASSSSSSKKRKIGGREWSHLLAGVQWPGLGESDSEPSDIDSYSEEESGGSDVHTDEGDGDHSNKGCSQRRGVAKNRRWRKTLDQLQTSTPLQTDRVAAECISDFDSSDSTAPSPHTPPISTLRTPPHNPIKQAKPISSFVTFDPDFQSTPDDISTPPSSPEGEEGDHTHSRTKPSEWLRGVSMDTDTSHVTESDLNVTMAMKTPLDSAKKPGSRRGRRRFVGGGLAEQLERVVGREGVEITFWEHKVKGLSESDVDTSTCLTVDVRSLVNCYSLFLATCTLIDGTPSLETTPTEATPTELSVLFSSRCAKSINLRVGSRVRIHPPWQCLSLPSLSRDLVLCTLFCQSLGHTPSLTTPTSPVPCKQRGVAGLLSVSSHLTSPLPARPSLTRSPIKSLSTSLYKHTGHSSTDDTPCDWLSPRVESDRVSDIPGMLLDGIEHAQCGLVGGVTGRVMRAYRRISRQLITMATPSEKQHPSVRRSLRYGSGGEGSKVTWCLLVCDVAGMFAEVQLTQSSGSPWSVLVERGEGQVFHFTDLKLVRRTNQSRSPELISLISSLKLRPPSLTSAADATPPTAPPAFCYILSTGQTSHAHSVPKSQEDVFPTLTIEERHGRVDLLARVVYFSKECLVSDANDGTSSLQTLCAANDGGYLHILTSSPAHSTTPHPSLLTVRLTPSFPTEGLLDLLSTPGAALLLRDVSVDPLGLEYSMDACSVAIPLVASERPTGYPVVRSCDSQLSYLHSLMTPNLPLLDQDNARPRRLVAVQGRVMSVEEEAAYSWPVCGSCGTSQLTETSSDLQCEFCDKSVPSPDVHLHLAVFLKCKELQNTRTHVTLLQSTIRQLLPISSSNLDDGFDVHCVLGQWLSLVACHVDEVIHNTDGTVLVKLREVDIHFK